MTGNPDEMQAPESGINQTKSRKAIETSAQKANDLTGTGKYQPNQKPKGN